MLQITLGEMLRRFRIEKEVDAKQVCKGLCSPAMMSYFEKGTRVPDTLLFEYLMERMGASAELFSVMVTKDEYKYHEWKERTCEAIRDSNWRLLKELLKSDVAQSVACNKKLVKQFFSYATAICIAKEERYTEAANLMKVAANQTIKDMYVLKKTNVLFSSMELHILMLYLYYGIKGNVLTIEEGLTLFWGLEKYIYNGRLELSEQAKCYSKLTCMGINLFKASIRENEQRHLCEHAIYLLREDKSIFDIIEVINLYIPLLSKQENTNLYFYKKQLEVFINIFKEENIDTSFQPEYFEISKPKFYMMHEYLVSKRNENDLTQAQLSEGICEPETYSRVEVGKRAPSRKNFVAFAERLHINWCFYRGELDADEIKAYELRRAQRRANIEGDYQEELRILHQIQEYLDMSSETNYQYVKYSEYMAKYFLKQMDEEEVYAKLEGLLNRTQRVRQYNKNDLVYYSQTEMEIIGRMAQILHNQGKNEEGIGLIENVINQMKNSKIKFENQWNGFSFLYRVLSSLYFSLGEYEEAIRVAKYVGHVMVKSGDIANLAYVYDEVAYNLENIGEQYSFEYEKLYRYTYYVADFCEIEIVKRFINDYYELNFNSNIKWY